MVVQLTPEWLEMEKQSGGRVSITGTYEQMKETLTTMQKSMEPFLPGPDPDVKREEKTIEGIKIRIYTPPNATGKDPLCLYTHGGGYALGDLDIETRLCDAISKRANAVIVSVDYRLAPKYKHPSALEDCLKMWRWSWENADSLGADKSRFFTAGSSAGGALALCIANAVVADPSTRNQIKGIIALIPATLHPDNVPEEYQAEYTAYEENKDAPILDEQSMLNFYEWVGADPKDEANFIGLAEKNHKYFPKTYLVVCEADPLRDDGLILEKQLKKAGVETKLDFYKGLPHSFWGNPFLPESKDFTEKVIEGVKFVLS